MTYAPNVPFGCVGKSVSSRKPVLQLEPRHLSEFSNVPSDQDTLLGRNEVIVCANGLAFSFEQCTKVWDVPEQQNARR
jgi:hypothetical protein